MAKETNPGNAFTWYVTSAYCHFELESACPHPDATRRLAEIDSDNGFVWLMLAAIKTDMAAQQHWQKPPSARIFAIFLARAKSPKPAASS